MSTKREIAEELLEEVQEHTDGEFETAALVAIGWMLGDVADAIREQTAELHPGGVRDDLGAIGHAIEKYRNLR